MNGLTLHSMKEIRVIVSGEHRAFVTEMLDKQATGYTVIGNVSGKGHHGVREAHFMFSEQESLVMIMAVVPEEKVEPILAGLRPIPRMSTNRTRSASAPSARVSRPIRSGATATMIASSRSMPARRNGSRRST